MTPDADKPPIPPLDEGLYKLDDAEITFFKQQTGIDDSDELKAHMLSIQAEAYEVYAYPCIRRFSWASLRISRFPAYQDLLKLGREREGAVLLDVGCCFGTDVRKAILDGFPLRNVVTTDLHKGRPHFPLIELHMTYIPTLEFWDLGHKLYKTTPDTFPVTFIPGDVFDPEHLNIVQPFTADSPPATSMPDLRTLTSLNPLHGHVSAIFAASFFHLFPEDAQVRLARALAGLLSPEPGSMIFGIQLGLPESGYKEGPSNFRRLFCHSPQSWSELWDGDVFPKGTVNVSAFVMEFPRDGVYTETDSSFRRLLIWSVIRL